MLTCDHAFACDHVDAVLPHVRVCSRDGLGTELMFDNDEPAITARELSNSDDTIGNGENRGAVGGSEVEP